jgi:fructose-specific phosphotransferase system IIC component
MTTTFALLIVMILDPVRAIPSLIVGWFLRNVLALIVGVVFVAATLQYLFGSRTVSDLKFTLSLIACLAWACVGHVVGKKLRARRVKS